MNRPAALGEGLPGVAAEADRLTAPPDCAGTTDVPSGPQEAGTAVLYATEVAGVASGPLAVAWGMAYLAAVVVGSFTWRPLIALGGHPVPSVAALCLTTLIDTALFGWFLALTVGGQMLGKAEAASVTLGVAAPANAGWRPRQAIRRVGRHA